MVSLAPSLRRLPRLVREIAAQLGKPIRFELSGEGVEVDKQIADGLFEPLLHLVRNALDHGIESADRRVAAGKAAEGLLRLGIRREGDVILVSLSDDGAGIDPDHIRRIAIARGLVTRETADALADAATIRLIFEPGFSTAETVTGVSGRGVGMDAVQAAVERLRGSIEIASSAGEGSAFTLRLPANAITTRLLVIEIGDDRYGVALDQIVETVRVGSNALIPLGSGTAVVLRDKTVPVLSLATLLGAIDHPTAAAKLLVTRSAGEPVAVRVDGFAERIDTLVRPPSGILAATAGVAGTTLTGEGDVLLVLDLPELVA
jgi:two-component system chemotaxis sensor kinase CheA